MNVVLWVLQAILSIKLLSAAFTHGLRHGQAEMEQGIEQMGPVARPVLMATALLLLLSSVSVVAPAVFNVPRWLVPLAAVLLGGMMLVSITLHVNCREEPHVFVSSILFVIAASVAYGRWFLLPL